MSRLPPAKATATRAGALSGTSFSGGWDVDTFTIGDSTYAIVAVYGTPGNEPGSNSGGVQIIDISDPDNIVAKGSMTDYDSR